MLISAGDRTLRCVLVDCEASNERVELTRKCHCRLFVNAVENCGVFVGITIINGDAHVVDRAAIAEFFLDDVGVCFHYALKIRQPLA